MAAPVGPTFLPKAVLTTGRVLHQVGEIPTEMTQAALKEGAVSHNFLGSVNKTLYDAIEALEPRGPAKWHKPLQEHLDKAIVGSANKGIRATEVFWTPFSDGAHQVAHAVSNPFAAFYAKRAGFEMPEDAAAAQKLLASITDPVEGSTKFPWFKHWPTPPAPPAETPPAETPPTETPAPKPEDGATKPDGEATPPADDATKPSGEATPPDGDATKPEAEPTPTGGEQPPVNPPADGEQQPQPTGTEASTTGGTPEPEAQTQAGAAGGSGGTTDAPPTATGTPEEAGGGEGGGETRSVAPVDAAATAPTAGAVDAATGATGAAVPIDATAPNAAVDAAAHGAQVAVDAAPAVDSSAHAHDETPVTPPVTAEAHDTPAVTPPTTPVTPAA